MTIIIEDLCTLQKDACDSITVGGGQYQGVQSEKGQERLSHSINRYFIHTSFERLIKLSEK